MTRNSQQVVNLIDRARGGGEALGALLDHYRNYLHLIARTQIDMHLAVRTSPSDIVQETFLQAAKEFSQFQGNNGPQLLAWLRTILVNNIVTSYNRHVMTQKRDLRRERPLEQVARSIDESSLLVEQALANSANPADAESRREELAAEVADMLAELPPVQREVIILRNLEGLPFNDVAERMGRSSNAVRKLWTRAISQLKLSQEGRGDG